MPSLWTCLSRVLRCSLASALTTTTEPPTTSTSVFSSHTHTGRLAQTFSYCQHSQFDICSRSVISLHAPSRPPMAQGSRLLASSCTQPLKRSR
ncbi:hypothetical protein HDK64DRAFT_54298 [Phyllosticta capitalensis]